MIITLETLDETLAFGEKLGQILLTLRPVPTVLLFGDLGAGKTTMVRGLVAGLPGANQAEVTSPSFNLVNLYPTRPQVAHIDLYRLEYGGLGDDVLDALEDECNLAIVEWAERLSEPDMPENWVRLDWRVKEALRSVEIRAKNPVTDGHISKALELG